MLRPSPSRHAIALRGTTACLHANTFQFWLSTALRRNNSTSTILPPLYLLVKSYKLKHVCFNIISIICCT